MEAIYKLLSFEEIVKDLFFKIPDYQRGYSWEEKQIEDLIKDIFQVADKDHMHFTGTIVITKSHDFNDIYEIVDGQQRLTTLIILLNEIYKLNPSQYSNIKETFLLRGEIGEERYVLETNNETNLYFKEAIIGDKKNLPADLKSLQNLCFAKKTLNAWVSENKGSIDTIYKVVTRKLGFICFAPINTKEIGIMFEVINNRGKELSELEKIKNYFIYYASINNKNNLRTNVDELWGKILAYLSEANITNNDEENRFLRNCYIVFISPNKSESWNVYENLKEKYIPGNIDDLDLKVTEISRFIDFILQASQFYAFLKKGDVFERDYKGDYKREIGSSLKRLRCHSVNASILPLYLASMSYIYSNPLNVSELLEIIEILNFRIYVIPNAKISRADTKQGDLFNWARELYRDRDWKSTNDDNEYITFLKRKIEGDIFTYIKMMLEDFIQYLCPEETFIQSLTIDADEAIDYYHWNDGLRFFLASYEEYLNADFEETWDIERILTRKDEALKNRNDYLSREHIWASRNRPEDFPEDFKDKRRLGNFILMGIITNIQLQNEDIEDKVKFLKENSSISMCQINQLEDYLKNAKYFAKTRRTKRTKYFYSDIAIKLIDQRENDLIKFALKRWKLPIEDFNTFVKVDSFDAYDKNMKEYYFLT